MPEQYYRMSPRDYYARVEGYNNKRRQHAEILRLSVWASLSSWQGSISFEEWSNKFFPLASDKAPDNSPVEIDSEEIALILERHKNLHAAKD